MIDKDWLKCDNLRCGIGSPASLGVFCSSTWNVVRGHFQCARSLTRYYQPRTRSALIGSQATRFKDSVIRRVGLCLHT
jgi:hypothetical protein